MYVDDIGETWVDIRRIPEGGYFHTERVRAYRSFKEAVEIRDELLSEYPSIRWASYAHRVRQRNL